MVKNSSEPPEFSALKTVGIFWADIFERRRERTRILSWYWKNNSEESLKNALPKRNLVLHEAQDAGVEPDNRIVSIVYRAHSLDFDVLLLLKIA